MLTMKSRSEVADMVTDETADCRLAEAEEIAQRINDICVGRNTASVMMAMAMLFGRMAAHAQRPDLDNLMRLIRGAAENAMYDHRADLMGHSNVRPS